MIYNTKEFVLKNGIKMILKSPEVRDAQMLLNQIIETTKVTDYLTTTENDFAPFIEDITKEEEFISKFIEGKDYLLCAYVNNIIVGNCMIRFLTHTKDKHRAIVGIAIKKEYWGLGIGSIMFDELIDIARNTPGIEQIELDVISQNQRAIALYTKKGFRKTGEMPHQLKLEDGTYLDSNTMILFLK